MISRTISTCLGATVAFLLVLPAKIDAQDLPFELEGRLGAAIPMGEISEADPGLSFGASIGYSVTRTVTILGGFTQSAFGADGGGTMRTGGFDLGARYAFQAAFDPWLRGGVVLHRWRETGFAASDRSFGFEAGGGAVVPVAGMIALTPGIRYTTFSPRWSGEGLGHGWVGTMVIDIGARVSL